MKPTVIDLHCDLLSYLLKAPVPAPFAKGSIGCSFPALEEGNVKLQVMAIYTAADKGSSELGLKQSRIFNALLTDHSDTVALVNDVDSLNTISTSSKIGIVAAIENASGFCEENETLKEGFNKLEQIIANTTRVLYIGFTHHGENRFGGGNTTKVGLKDDGRTLLDYMSGRKIALDFAHTSDPLAYDMLEHISKHNLDIPIIASHSNFRKVWDHPRNLPDDIAAEIIKRNGLIGMNFLRAFVNDHDPNALYDHMLYGIELGGSNNICLGADYFYTDNHPDHSRRPFFFREHDNASCYPAILEELSTRVSQGMVESIAHKNAFAFISRLWS